ncbi:MAG: aspartate kinase [Bacteroidetes bacterium]|nr:aspartate kinase [Bacteroidota bacterium]
MNQQKLKVIKFDGECISSKENLLRTVSIIMSEKDFPIIVVPAFDGMTDLLIEGIEKAKGKEVNVSDTISILTETHYNIAQEAIKNDKVFNKTIQEITVQIKKAERLLYGVAYTEEITDAVSAYILSYGERIAAIILSGVLEDNGCNSKIIETDKIGLVTDENFESAIVNLEDFKRNFNFTAHSIVNDKIIPIFTGFFGSTPEGKVTTFGRGGGDYTAAVLAYGFGASQLEIWKSGTAFMSADPEKVKNARIIEKLSYFEAAELVYFGKRVLHPLTIEPVAGAEIPIFVKNISCPECGGTQIGHDAYIEENIIKSVSQNESLSMIRINGTGIGYKPGLIRKFSNALSAENINIFATVSSQTTINLIIGNKDAELSYEILNKYKGKIIEKIDFVRNIALVAVIGEGLVRKRGIFARILSAVSKEKVNVEMASAGASEVAIYIIVPKDELNEVVNAIHEEFFPEAKN